MESETALPKWASKPCIMGIDEAGRGPVLGPMVYGCLYCARSYQKTLSTLKFADSKTLKEEKREELFENLKADESIGWAVDVIDPRELSSKMLKKNKINLNEISHDSAMGLIRKVLSIGILLTEVTRDRALRDWVLDETAANMHTTFGSGYPGDPQTKAWLEDHKHSIFGFPTLVRFSWGTCTSYSKDMVEVLWETDDADEDGSDGRTGKRQLKLTNVGFTPVKRKSEETESSGKGRCKFFQARKLELLSHF
ncbi:ribonuclease H2 subunit A isoform X2 [Olea europaea var. sylvestris]|uniref:ribonuclease H2 subunit A isoform X2 n=1 Tax=Olea europaea var. sylvestris TaxID=158386 RepID=UPI000C1D1705|nr:ribonuclease H2 subunit A isoform X2 [Olea europaea var. sylvestris]